MIRSNSKMRLRIAGVLLAVLTVSAAAIDAPAAGILVGATVLSAVYIGKCFLSLID